MFTGNATNADRGVWFIYIVTPGAFGCQKALAAGGFNFLQVSVCVSVAFVPLLGGVISINTRLSDILSAAASAVCCSTSLSGAFCILF